MVYDITIAGIRIHSYEAEGQIDYTALVHVVLDRSPRGKAYRTSISLGFDSDSAVRRARFN